MTIYQAIVAIMADVDAIGKTKRNQTQGFNFRGIDDVYNAIHPLLAKHGVFTVPEVLEDRSEDRLTKSGGTLIYRILKIRYTFYAADGSFVQAVVIGEGMDSGDKASNKAMSIAHKYAFFQVFSIPTDEVAASDPDNETPPESVRVDVSQYIIGMETAETMDDLQTIFKAGWLAVGNNSQARHELTAAKDAKKKALAIA